MHHVQNREGKEKGKLSLEIYKFWRNGGKFIKFAEVRGICIIGLEGMPLQLDVNVLERQGDIGVFDF